MANTWQVGGPRKPGCDKKFSQGPTAILGCPLPGLLHRSQSPTFRRDIFQAEQSDFVSANYRSCVGESWLGLPVVEREGIR